MFSSIRNFLHRHRRKFLIGGTIVGGVVLLSRYAEYKLFQWHEEQTRSLIEKQMRRQHYEKTRQMANATALSLSESISKIVCDELEVDSILQAIASSKPEMKRALWEELKIIGFSRAVASIYVSSLVGSVVQVSMMILGSYTFSKIEESEVELTSQCQEKFLSHLQAFVEKGLPYLVKKINSAVHNCAHSIPLNQAISLERLEALLKDITLLLDGEVEYDEKDVKLNPWSQYITNCQLINTSNSTDSVFQRMTLELADIVDGEDFNTVIKRLVQNGVNHIVDHVTDHYPSPPAKEFEENICNISQENGNIVKASSTSGSEGFPNGGNISSNVNPFTKSTLPLAKLIPILSDLVIPCLSPEPGQLLQFVLLNEQLENLSFNIYEAFSTNKKC